jgi:hypothetical protein
LTIKHVKPHQKWVLNYPNQEVKQAFGQFLLAEFTNVKGISDHEIKVI